MQKWASRSGFTIVELIVVIVVLAILVSIAALSYTGIQQRSRDSQRASDITQLKIAIDKYRIDNGVYPPACGADGTGCAATKLANYLKPYLKEIPTDPVGTSTYQYLYVRGTVASDSYALRVNYEAKPQCKTGVRVSANWWGTAIPVCS